MANGTAFVLRGCLLQDVLARLVELSVDIGCRGLLVHAEPAEARTLYLHLVPEFEASPTDELHLVLLALACLRRSGDTYYSLPQFWGLAALELEAGQLDAARALSTRRRSSRARRSQLQSTWGIGGAAIAGFSFSKESLKKRRCWPVNR
jgi:hypothetical protein